MIVLGIDPGPETSGVVIYDSAAKRVLWSDASASTDEVLRAFEPGGFADLCNRAWAEAVVIEQVESYGIPGNSLLMTAEVCGRFRQRAIDSFGVAPVLMPRREVKRVLGVVGGGADGQVREAMLARHGGTKQAAQGSKKAPGPLYGLSSHAWQALGLVVAWMERESAVGAWCAAHERPVRACGCGR